MRRLLDLIISVFCIGTIIYLGFNSGTERGRTLQAHDDSLSVTQSDDSARVWRERWQQQRKVNGMLVWNADHPARVQAKPRGLVKK